MGSRLNVTLPFDQDLESFVQKEHSYITDFRVVSKSLDARGAQNGKKPSYHYALEYLSDESDSYDVYSEEFKQVNLSSRPIIVGAGPAGLFAALRLLEYGVKSIIIERGDVVDRRMSHIARFWRYGQFNPESNVCFGEGGAGLFSDGKLLTRIKSPYIKYVMKKLVDFGAPAETEYISDPHLGSNKLRKIIDNISNYLRESGCEIRCNTRVDELLFEKNQVTGVRLVDGEKIEGNNVILAVGHSAKELYRHLYQNSVEMKQKDFAVGVRIEHSRKYMDYLQYGDYSQDHYGLGAARYRLSWHDKGSDRGVYSFCMCPGGYVLSSGSDADGLVTNGMSNYARNSRWSNSALIVSVKAGVDFSGDNLLAGVEFQHAIERSAFALTQEHGGEGRHLPAQTVKDFLNGKTSGKKLPQTSSPSGVVETSLDKILPDFVTDHLRRALNVFDRKIKGFKHDEALLIAPETRTSAPLTIVRDRETMQSTSHIGLYPCGEGAGYAGGITSAAVDGIKAAMAVVFSG